MGVMGKALNNKYYLPRRIKKSRGKIHPRPPLVTLSHPGLQKTGRLFVIEDS